MQEGPHVLLSMGEQPEITVKFGALLWAQLGFLLDIAD